MPTVSKSYMGSTGISVSDLNRSLDFYTRIIGLKKIYGLKLPHMEEAILAFEGRPETPPFKAGWSRCRFMFPIRRQSWKTSVTKG